MPPELPLEPSVGQAVLHLFCHVPSGSGSGSGFDAEVVRQAVKSVRADGYQVVPAALLGHKADLGSLAAAGLPVRRPGVGCRAGGLLRLVDGDL
jgi:hypothetical protein